MDMGIRLAGVFLTFGVAPPGVAVIATHNPFVDVSAFHAHPGLAIVTGLAVTIFGALATRGKIRFGWFCQTKE